MKNVLTFTLSLFFVFACWQISTATTNPSLEENEQNDPLELTCPDNITVNTAQGLCSAWVNVPAATATGGCGDNTITDSENGTGNTSGNYDKGSTTIVYTVVDACGNTDNCTTTITVNDNQGPQLVCRSGNVNLDFDETLTFGAADVTSVAVDNCNENIFVSASPASVDCGDIGSTIAVEVTWRDLSWNTSTCIANVTIEDMYNICCEGPNAVCNDFTVVLDNNGMGSITVADVASGSTADCGFAFDDISQTDFDCDDVGNANVVIYTITDSYGDSDNCTSNITVVDDQGPQLVCRSGNIRLDYDGTFTFGASDVTSVAIGSCGNIFVDAVPASVDCDDIGSTIAVEVTWRDLSWNTSTCIAYITVTDPFNYCCASPNAVCNDFTVILDGNGEGSITFADVASGSEAPCGLAYEDLSETNFDCDDIGGSNVVTYTITDGYADNDDCTSNITVVDNTPPTPQCKTGTVYLNGDGVYTLEEADVFDGGTDNCGMVNYVSANPASLSCADDGNTVSVTVTADDGNGNTANCTANITVLESGDLPSGWAAYDIGQVTMGNDYYYAACDALPTYELTGSGNNTMGTTSDNVAFAGYQLCGDGSITVKVESITPNGYGGVMIRESGAPGAKQVSLFSNMTNSLRHEYRSTTNGMKIVGSFFKPNPIWLKLDRQGDWVFAYSSFDGNTFQYVHGAYVPMQSCVEFGMASFTYLPFAQTDAVFSNVSITGGNGGLAVESPNPKTKPTKPSSTSLNLSVYPSPNNGNFTVQFDEVFHQEVQLVLYNPYGQLIEQKTIAPQTRNVEWNVLDINSGTYFMHLIGEGIEPQVKSIVVNR